MPQKSSAETDKPSSAQTPRRELKALRIYCTREECEDIQRRAKISGLSVSGYARRVCMGYQPTSVIDYEVAEKVIKLTGDLGRMGGLLKWWLSGKAPVMKTTWGSQVFIGEKELRTLLGNIDKTLNSIRSEISLLLEVKGRQK